MSDIVTNFFSHLTNCARRGKKEVYYRPISKLILNILEVMKRHGYVESYEVVTWEKGGVVKVVLSDSFNKAGAIKPRFPVQKRDWEWYEKIYLPARDFGILIVSTSQGVMSNKEAKKLGIGGVLIGYVY